MLGDEAGKKVAARIFGMDSMRCVRGEELFAGAGDTTEMCRGKIW